MTHVSTAMLITGDLFFTSQIEGVARAAGVRLQVASRLPDPHSEADCDLMILDLELPGLDFDALSQRLETHPLRIVGYGPHVKTQLFEAAKNAGVGHLVSRGQLRDRLPEFFG